MAGSPVPTHRKNTMKKLTLILAAFALAFGGFTATASAAAPIDGLRIGQIGYNAVGNDRPWNRNQEYVDVTNVSRTPVDVKDLTVRDSWSKRQGDSYTGPCNTYKVTELPGVTVPDAGPDAGKLLLPAGHTVRVYVGSGTPKVFGFGNRIHAVYMDHGVGASAGCGYHGHFLNNTHDTVWIKLGDREERKSYDFRRGYHVN